MSIDYDDDDGDGDGCMKEKGLGKVDNLRIMEVVS
jgi:hypothetical protein